jgi:hypothetical protein
VFHRWWIEIADLALLHLLPSGFDIPGRCSESRVHARHGSSKIARRSQVAVRLRSAVLTVDDVDSLEGSLAAR